MKKYVLYLSLLAACVLSACGNSDSDNNETQKNDTLKNQTGDTTLTKNSNAAKLDTADVTFFEQAAYGGMVEVESSNAILQHTKDAAVKTFAQMMVKDHGAANVKLKTLAEQKGYILPPQLPMSKVETINKMNTLKDEGRDEYYMQLMAAEHQKAIQIFSMASRSHDKDIAAFASALLPTLNHHYEHTKRIDSTFKAIKANQGDDPLKLSDRKKH